MYMFIYLEMGRDSGLLHTTLSLSTALAGRVPAAAARRQAHVHVQLPRDGSRHRRPNVLFADARPVHQGVQPAAAQGEAEGAGHPLRQGAPTSLFALFPATPCKNLLTRGQSIRVFASCCARRSKRNRSLPSSRMGIWSPATSSSPGPHTQPLPMHTAPHSCCLF